MQPHYYFTNKIEQSKENYYTIFLQYPQLLPHPLPQRDLLTRALSLKGWTSSTCLTTDFVSVTISLGLLYHLLFLREIFFDMQTFNNYLWKKIITKTVLWIPMSLLVYISLFPWIEKFSKLVTLAPRPHLLSSPQHSAVWFSFPPLHWNHSSQGHQKLPSNVLSSFDWAQLSIELWKIFSTQSLGSYSSGISPGANLSFAASLAGD